MSPHTPFSSTSSSSSSSEPDGSRYARLDGAHRQRSTRAPRQGQQSQATSGSATCRYCWFAFGERLPHSTDRCRLLARAFSNNPVPRDFKLPPALATLQRVRLQAPYPKRDGTQKRKERSSSGSDRPRGKRRARRRKVDSDTSSDDSRSDRSRKVRRDNRREGRRDRRSRSQQRRSSSRARDSVAGRNVGHSDAPGNGNNNMTRSTAFAVSSSSSSQTRESLSATALVVASTPTTTAQTVEPRSPVMSEMTQTLPTLASQPATSTTSVASLGATSHQRTAPVVSASTGNSTFGEAPSSQVPATAVPVAASTPTLPPASTSVERADLTALSSVSSADSDVTLHPWTRSPHRNPAHVTHELQSGPLLPLAHELPSLDWLLFSVPSPLDGPTRCEGVEISPLVIQRIGNEYGLLSTATSRVTTPHVLYDRKWIIDSGASAHSTPHADWFVQFLPHESLLRVGDNHGLRVRGVGMVKFTVVVVDSTGATTSREVTLRQVLYVPELKFNLFSVGAAFLDRLKPDFGSEVLSHLILLDSPTGQAIEAPRSSSTRLYAFPCSPCPGLVSAIVDDTTTSTPYHGHRAILAVAQSIQHGLAASTTQRFSDELHGFRNGHALWNGPEASTVPFLADMFSG
ncbi:hypothetical protein SDRG_06488 [Saprolegnia diclina VS20]|uniref:Retrovirus-related Pol polyprotein from transposon TNT 1-94-like beta-barrel domain-containing protein n=1 Tax=Saprolegnia diclina (strain VS20) TaxID=1156394 RepID=T0QR52_SAPDV|nr:hypothetical protein SDRG_06488 [Saprolegnia diclina VS20]EQC36385.1 hypothetical protein SDRG_06488 [Saprolegnia diclina VS20]|eukprot:XP_008610491.1 hypothetical protein SDRG_06488 [Saprolegnia diclina VS20]